MPNRAGNIETLEGYDRWASEYDAHDNPLITMVEYALDRQPLPIRDRRIVELGCGTGRHAIRMLRNGVRHYTGVDASDEMLRVARGRMEHETVTWQKHDLRERLPCEGGAFDVVLITLLLEHFVAVAPLVFEAARLLVAGGYLRIVELHPELWRRGTRAHFHSDGQQWNLPSYVHEAAEFEQAIASAGLGLESIHPLTPPASLCERVAKLRRYQDQSMVLDLTARS